MLWALLESQSGGSIVAIILHHQEIVIVIVGVHRSAGHSLDCRCWISLHVSHKSWCIWETSSIVDGTMLVCTANPAIILVGGVIVKHVWCEVVCILGAVGILIDLVVFEPHRGGVLLVVCISVVTLRISCGSNEAVCGISISSTRDSSCRMDT